MQRKQSLFYLIPILGLIALFQNCAQPDVVLKQLSDFDTEIPYSADQPAETPIEKLPEPPGPKQDLITSCKDAKYRGKIQSMLTEVTFENPARSCAFGRNGNLEKRNDTLTSRIEQLKSIPLPEDYKVCQIELVNIDEQNFRYDDNIIITMNNIILASTTNFTEHLESRSGYFLYDWMKLRGKDARARPEHSTPNKQYCPGKDAGKATCQFPQTDTVGSIQLQFDERIIQEVLNLTSPNRIDLGMTTTGDNDDSDCQHVPIRFSIKLEYFQ